MHVVSVEVPHLGNRSHLVHDGSVAVVIDPPRDVSGVEAAASEAGVQIVAVAETHLHDDYVSGAVVLAYRHGADLLLNADEVVEFAHIGVRDHETLAYGDLDLRVIATPGHSPHHLAYLAVDSSTPDLPGALFSGGCLLDGGVGRTDLAGPALVAPLTRAQWLSARRLGALPAETRLHATHGVGSHCATTPGPLPGSEATIGAQRTGNPALTSPRDGFAADLVAGLGPVPTHCTHVGPRNRTGAWLPAVGEQVGPSELAAAVRRGAQVLDVRPSEEYAAGHLPGSLTVPFGDQSAVYAAWVTPWGSDLVLVSDAEDELTTLVGHLASIGVEGVTTSVLRRTTADWTTSGHTDWAGFVAGADAADRVVLDVRNPVEWAAGHLPGAVNIPVHELSGRLDEVPPGQVWVHCQAGYRAAVATGLLDRAGRDVVHVDDRLEQAGEHGLVLVRSPAAA